MGENIFAAVEAARQETAIASGAAEDAEVLFVGSKQAGKSTVINSFLQKAPTRRAADPPPPTSHPPTPSTFDPTPRPRLSPNARPPHRRTRY